MPHSSPHGSDRALMCLTQAHTRKSMPHPLPIVPRFCYCWTVTSLWVFTCLSSWQPGRVLVPSRYVRAHPGVEGETTVLHPILNFATNFDYPPSPFFSFRGGYYGLLVRLSSIIHSGCVCVCAHFIHACVGYHTQHAVYYYNQYVIVYNKSIASRARALRMLRAILLISSYLLLLLRNGV